MSTIIKHYDDYTTVVTVYLGKHDDEYTYANIMICDISLIKMYYRIMYFIMILFHDPDNDK